MTHPHPLSLAVRRALAAATLIAGSAGLVACGGGDGSSSDSGSLTLGVTDAPVDSATAVVVEFSSVTLKPADGEPFTIELDPAESVDLLQQQNGNSELLLDNEQVTAGDYDWVRLGVNEGVDSTYITIDSAGGPAPLDVPSGQNTGLKLVSGFNVAAGGSLALTIDFDLRKSVVEANGSYKLRPALRLVHTDETGEIAASATGTYIGNNCADADAQAVYVFEGAGVTPDDIDGQDPEPVTTAALTNEDADDTYTGTAGFLEAGTYTVAFTCDPEDDNAPTEGSANDDSLTFLDVRNVEVVAGETANYDLP